MGEMRPGVEVDGEGEKDMCLSLKKILFRIIRMSAIPDLSKPKKSVPAAKSDNSDENDGPDVNPTELDHPGNNQTSTNQHFPLQPTSQLQTEPICVNFAVFSTF
jgi:hypothetical protein